MRKSILILCALVLAACLWLVLHGKPGQPKTEAPETQTTAPTASQPSQAHSMPSAPAQTTPVAHAAMNAVFRDSSQGSNEIQQRALQEWQAPIDFYGKVIDDSSNPVAGASIIFKWTEIPTEDGNKMTMAQSDSDGLFSLRDARGPELTVSVSKDGYYASRSTPDSFRYALGPGIISPSPWNPVVFHLRKKGEGASLIEEKFPSAIGQIWQLHHDGTPVNLDLLDGKQVPIANGQLQLEFWRDISDRNAAVFDWKLQISAPGGGLVLADEEFPFNAPQNGYQPSVVINMPATNQDWLSELRTKYYIHLPNGDYGRFDLYLLPDNGVFTVNSAVNPTGSQNLEPAQ